MLPGARLGQGRADGLPLVLLGRLLRDNFLVACLSLRCQDGGPQACFSRNGMHSLVDFQPSRPGSPATREHQDHDQAGQRPLSAARARMDCAKAVAIHHLQKRSRYEALYHCISSTWKI
jgi:hypothetical protein